MQALTALIKREYLEHRGAFVYGPAILLALFLAGGLYSLIGVDIGGTLAHELPNALRFYETSIALAAAGWLIYLLIMLFFYYGDAFSADSRNNSMLFWKSMPQSDLKILASKVAASLTVFPAAILVALALTGILAYLPALSIGSVMPAFAPPDIGTTLSAWGNVMLAALVLFAIGLLWYLPFLAWVGFLSVMFKRWAIPLAFLIPAIIGVFERVIAENLLVAGQFWTFITKRFELHFEGLEMEAYWLTGEPWNGMDLIALMLAGTDWVSLAGGVAVAVVLVYAASEYRRRFVLT
ncbi:hypothetical protein [Pelagibacterium lacus]|uniref:Uncharacterized protein n=1 Tax=Pelagibacterium lacus TaxID=2282655 RepID=A0A369W2R1_9HYPH|nr:hypothetical protein [Pelagibacterium lacus]RDE08653.1 hypothetical protein DVH29_10155 [Pelagibacterium lacus]